MLRAMRPRVSSKWCEVCREYNRAADHRHRRVHLRYTLRLTGKRWQRPRPVRVYDNDHGASCSCLDCWAKRNRWRA